MNIKAFTDKLSAVIDDFDQYFKERQAVIRGALLAILSKEHILLLGPPGTAKSLLARKMCNLVENANFFYYLLTRFTVPEEIFGPLSLKALEEDKFSRKIENYLPTANIAFIDEIFKANSSILNSLLTIINERLYHNGSEIVSVPLLTIFGASNELPEEGENLEALYDRFLFRYSINNIEEESNFVEVVLNKENDFVPRSKLSMEEITKIHEDAKSIELSERAVQILLELRRKFKESDIYVSDRRWKKIIHILKVSAVALGRKEVDETLMLICKDLLWDIPEQLNFVRQYLIKLVGSGGIDIVELKNRIDSLRENIKDDMDYLFPKKIQCYNCKFTCSTLRELNAHVNETNNHRFRCPECGSIVYGNQVINHVETQHNWIFNETLNSKRVSLYKKEFSELQKDYDTLQKSVNENRLFLEKHLRSNLWIIEKDRVEVLAEFDNTIKEMKNIEAVMADISSLLYPKESS